MEYTKQLARINEDVSKLIEMGVSPDLIRNLDRQGIRELLKGLLYLKAKYCAEDVEMYFSTESEL